MLQLPKITTRIYNFSYPSLISGDFAPFAFEQYHRLNFFHLQYEDNNI